MLQCAVYALNWSGGTHPHPMINREPRPVGFKTILDLLKQKPMHLTMGLVFSIIPFLIGGIMISILHDPDVPTIDYEAIDQNGTTTKGTITNIDTQTNLLINNEHPQILHYQYFDGVRTVEDKFKVLDPDKVDRMAIGDTVDVKYLADGSIIMGLEPLNGSMNVFWNILLIFLVIGAAILFLLYWRIRRQANLYRYGEVRDAEIISLTPKAGLHRSGLGQTVIVHYQYNSRGQNVLGESETSDYTILTSKTQGDTIKIFVSPENESRSCLVSKLDQLRNNWMIG